ncbi:methyltransferase type 12 [Aliifodinibius salipaludis]|uniref:Methyltransferase type 12 n=1 Tax=Fodinibius salipaludis TaxID=2032627 RepID=A0A2A2GAU4_9BACT|nr:class I SAM-dependent methyltransferase [Aliifodinibius salipaludis]PAU93965.1 methyltransferase type 12 [Aliifodinibius salipaludis]
MSNTSENPITEVHTKNIAQYYRFHSHIYDATRWSFLFGRKTLVEEIPSLPTNARILEVGCGTGDNLIQLKQRFPNTQITGIDISTDMLGKARTKITDPAISLKRRRYGAINLNEEPYDLILLSYSLTMMGAGYPQIITELKNDLSKNGYLAIVDFHTSPLPWFRKWMKINHADFSGELYPLLKESFSSVQTSFHNAYLGLWNYFLFIGTQN